MHRHVLARHSDTFRDADSISHATEVQPEGDVVGLAESAEVLDLLLSLVYRLDRAKKNLKSASFDVLNAVADAAEKYSFDVARAICEVYMWYAPISRPSRHLK